MPHRKSTRHRRRVVHDPFAAVERAADAAAAEVLEEDRLLREYGIEPANGRSR